MKPNAAQLIVVALLSACGGSGSETPPPIEPSPKQMQVDEESAPADSPIPSSPDQESAPQAPSSRE